MIDTAQSLGSAYHVVIEKVYLCSGLDGYVPKFDPSVNEFGCLADSNNLLYRFKILVRILVNALLFPRQFSVHLHVISVMNSEQLKIIA